MMSLKEKTISGLQWSFLDSMASQGVQFVAGIILARVLSPKEFGLIGSLSIFIAISQSFVDSGFATALIRKNRCTQEDYSTVFYYNVFSSIIFYLLLLIFAGAISAFFKEPQLKLLIQVLGLGLILNSFTIIQQTIYTKELNFKIQMWVSLASASISGILAIAMSLCGYGVWSLVAMTLSRFGISAILLWAYSSWRPKLVFSNKSFKELFSFGNKMLLSSLLDTAYRNVNYLVIGKYFSSTELGYYTRADQFQTIPSANIQAIIGKVTYPVLSSIQDNSEELKGTYIKLIRSTMLITFVLMIGMAAIAKPMIITLIGLKWEPAVIYLQLLCFVGMFYPLHALNLNILKVKGRSDIFLRLEVIKKILAIPTIIIGILWGIKIMIIGMIFNSIISFFLNSYWSGRLIGYSSAAQIKDILPSFFIAALMGLIVYPIDSVLKLPSFYTLLIQIVAGGVFTIGIAELVKLRDYLYLKEIIAKLPFKSEKSWIS